MKTSKQKSKIHEIGETVISQIKDTDGPSRFTVTDVLAIVEDDISGGALEVLKTAKGNFLFYDQEAMEYGLFSTKKKLMNSLNLSSGSERKLFVALGGTIEDAIPEV